MRTSHRDCFNFAVTEVRYLSNGARFKGISGVLFIFDFDDIVPSRHVIDSPGVVHSNLFIHLEVFA